MPMPAVFHIGRVREALRGARQASPRRGVLLTAHAGASCLADKNKAAGTVALNPAPAPMGRPASGRERVMAYWPSVNLSAGAVRWPSVYGFAWRRPPSV